MSARSNMSVAILATWLAGFAIPWVLAHASDEAVPQDEIENTYRAQAQGWALFQGKNYDEAVEYLEFAAERGFKHAQVLLGQILFDGLGDVPQNVNMGIGWLGVGAEGESEARLRQSYEMRREALVKRLTDAGRDANEVNDQIDNLVNTFISSYDGKRTRVVCELVQQAGTHGKVTRCRYLDEANYPTISLTPMR